MELYLPIAELSVNWAVIMALGATVGFLSGMFGVGGGFLMTPLLVFYGIPPAIAVATQASHITASSLSGTLAQWRKRSVDAKMGLLLVAGGLVGSVFGVYLFRLLQDLGQIELAVNGGYVVLLGSVGGLMLTESMRTLLASRRGEPRPASGARLHWWIHRLPLRAQFRTSKLYISVIPPIVLGFLVGMLTAVLGVGGGFILIPAMIYLLRMPTNVVVGTSQFQILFVTAATTVFHAAGDRTVDIVLGFLLIVGGVIGVQFGVQAGSRLRGEQLRALLGFLVVGVALRILIGLVTTPDDIYSIVAGTP